MSDSKTATDAFHFDVVLHPHRSLSPTGFYALMAFVSVVCFGAGLAFMAIGAWPVLGFLGLDVLAIYVAFRLSYRSGRLFERLHLSDRALSVSRVHPNGRTENWQLPPNWLRVQLDGGGHGPGAVRLRSHGREIAVGRFLSPEERRSLAEALEEALRRWRLAPHLS
ncbi:MAG: DUF2244 domain-containing protein [Alphaproteobacteria bacterium]|jgi:uncharacterized membrane protein|nr:DUF2244 domain-containing protein [Alphaproteobacteria bacterium]